MNEKIRVGIIGCGGIANGTHLKQLANVQEAVITALCDIDPTHLKNTAEKYNIDSDHCFEKYHDLIQCPDVDVIEICTPNNLHCPMATDVLAAGKPVHIEKPVGMNASETVALGQYATDKGLPVMVSFSYRFMPAVRYAKKLMGDGLIGQVVSVYAQYLKSSAYIPGRRLDWRFDKDIARYGVSGDLAVHIIDMVRLLVGDFKAVCAQTGIAVKERKRLDSEEIAPVTTDDFCHFIAELEHEIPAVFTVSRCAQGNNNHIMIDIYGDRGALRFDLNHPEQLQLFKDGDKIDEMKTIIVPDEYKITQEQAFINMLLGNEPDFMPTLQDGIKAQYVLDALLDSVEQKSWISISK